MGAPLATTLIATIIVVVSAVPAAVNEVIAKVCLNKFPPLRRGSDLTIASFVPPFCRIRDLASFISPPPL